MPRTPLQTVLIAAAAGAGLFLAWTVAETLLLVFAGLLLGVLLDALTRALGTALPLARGWRLAIVCLGLLALAAGSVAWGGYALVSEWDQLARVMSDQLEALRHQIDNLGIAPPSDGKDDIQTLAGWLLPDPGRLFGGARSAFSAALGMVGSAVVILLIGVFAAADPALYRSGFLALVPPARRRRLGEVLDEMATALRWWLVGQLVTMAVAGVSIGVVLTLLGVPGAMLLGLQAAVVNFIPYLGPLVAAVPILLATASLGLEMVAWVLGVYLVIQAIEGYILMPLIQDRTVHVPPVLALAALLLFGALFGAPGVATAIPLTAVLRVAVLRLYVEDVLHARRAPAASRAA